MVGLRNIGPLTRTVEIHGENYQVRGLTARGIVELIDRFPEIRKMLSGRGSDDGSITVDKVLTLAPEALGAIVACGLGATGDRETEENAQNLTVGVQAEILADMLELTFGPKGMAHFQRILDTFAVPGGASDGTGKGLGTKLPSHFSSAFETDTRPKQPGTTPPGNSGDGQSSSPEATPQPVQTS